jgi:hypothetical protein
MSNGYDYEPQSGGNGLFLKLAEKGQQIDIRLASTPVRELKIWKEGEVKPIEDEKVASLTPDQLDEVKSAKDGNGKPKYRLSEQFSWIVIDRADGVAKVFTAPVSVYRKIKDFAINDKWGDPVKYDFTITRTEEPGNAYYQVMTDPNKSELTQEEIEAAKAVDILDLKSYAKPIGDGLFIAGQEVAVVTTDGDALGGDADAL